jgi:pimeloyl-ACP methyl ester carboxylesterase
VLAGAAGIVTGTRRSQRAIALVAAIKPGRRISRFGRVVSASAFLRGLVFRVVAVADPRALPQIAAEGFLAGSGLNTGVREAGDALVRTDPRADLERLRCPALVLHGARDAQVPLRDGFEYARRLGAPVRTIADCGHLLIGERPRAVVDAIADFLDRVVDVDELPLEGELVG